MKAKIYTLTMDNDGGTETKLFATEAAMLAYKREMMGYYVERELDGKWPTDPANLTGDELDDALQEAWDILTSKIGFMDVLSGEENEIELPDPVPPLPVMDLLLIHGRKTPDEKMDDWGPDGPTLHGVIAMHATYMSTFALYFESNEAANAAQLLTGWPFWDEHALEMKFQDDLLRIKPETGDEGFYGDWELQTVDGTGKAVCDKVIRNEVAI